MADELGREAAEWSPGTRSDDLGRAAAAYLARRRFGYPAVAVARALGYCGHSSVRAAVARIESNPGTIQSTLAALQRTLANA